MSKLIIITGKQGSGKTTIAKELAKKYAWRRPYKKEVEDAKFFDYSKENIALVKHELTIEKSNVILCIQKDQLHEIVNGENRRDFLIIDMDILCI